VFVVVIGDDIDQRVEVPVAAFISSFFIERRENEVEKDEETRRRKRKKSRRKRKRKRREERRREEKRNVIIGVHPTTLDIRERFDHNADGDNVQ
jgi:hypothetical protein